MSQNWMRHFELQLVDGNGQGIELSDFKVTFTIDWFNISSASRVGTIKIYNLSADTVNRITGQEFSKVRLIAGYDGIAPEVSASDVGTVREVDAADVGQSDGRNYGLIFSGEIRYSVTGKDSPVDSYVLIQAADTDLAFATSITSQTLAAGYTVADVNRALMKDFEAKGATEGLTPEMPATVFPRGRVLFGMTRHLMDNVAGQCGATWQFVDGQRQMVANNEYVHEAIVLNSATGLIGMPQQTIGNGVNVRALINPNIRVNGLIQLDQAAVYRTALSNNDIAMAGGQITDQNTDGNITLSGTTSQPASIATDGVYIVRGIMYTGDTRGQAWYMDMMCRWIFSLLALVSVGVSANTITMQCGNFRMDAIPDSLFKINGETVTSQKVKMLGKDGTGMQIKMELMPAKDGNNYGFEYIHRPGTKTRFLNVQLLQNSMDAPKIIGSFPCKKVVG